MVGSSEESELGSSEEVEGGGSGEGGSEGEGYLGRVVRGGEGARPFGGGYGGRGLSVEGLSILRYLKARRGSRTGRGIV
jgi:hypothetical protein